MEMPPALDPQLVHEFVAVSHGNAERVRELLAQEPALVNAAWDWGGGDWETGLGAAAMLGQLEVIKAILTANPAQRHAPGPHNISLYHHAQMGGDAAAAVVAYLETFTD